MKEVGKREFPEKTSDDELQKVTHSLKTENSTPTETQTHTLPLVTGYEADVLTIALLVAGNLT